MLESFAPLTCRQYGAKRLATGSNAVASCAKLRFATIRMMGLLIEQMVSASGSSQLEG